MFVRKSLRQVVFTLVTTALVLTACNMGATPAPTVDVNAINTAAVETAMGQLSAQFTQTAIAAPSATSISTNTAVSLPTMALATSSGALSTTSGALPTTSGALPTVSFNSTPVSSPIAGFTQLASPAAPSGAATQALGDACNNNVFEADVTIPDGSILNPGENFQKIWAIRNTGSCTWDEGYVLVYIGGSNPNLDPYNYEFKKNSDFVAGGAGVNIGLNLTTPCQPGKYEGHWRMRDDKGNYFGTILSVYVEVQKKC